MFVCSHDLLITYLAFTAYNYFTNPGSVFTHGTLKLEIAWNLCNNPC